MRTTELPDVITSQSVRSGQVLMMGTGEQTVVCLHGLFGSPMNWLTPMSGLADRYSIVAPQLPIDRQPDRRATGLQTVDELTDFVERLIDELELKRFVLCGNSLGGLVSIDYCLRHPRRVSGLILAGSAGLQERSLTNGVRPQASRPFVRALAMDILHNHELVTDELVEEWYESFCDRDYVRFILRVSRATRDCSVADRLHELKVPTMLIWGRDDRVTPPSVAEEFARYVAHARLAFVDNCGHAPNLEQPHVFGELVEEFLPACFSDAASLQ